MRPQRCYPLRAVAGIGLFQRQGWGWTWTRGGSHSAKGGSLDGVSQSGRSAWLGSVVGVIWQRSGVTLAMVSRSGVSHSIWWSFWLKSDGLAVIWMTMGPLWPGTVSWGPLWLRSICLGVTYLGQSVWGLLWLRSDGLGVPLTRSVSLGVLAAHVAWLRRKPRKELALLGSPQGHG